MNIQIDQLAKLATNNGVCYVEMFYYINHLILDRQEDNFSKKSKASATIKFSDGINFLGSILLPESYRDELATSVAHDGVPVEREDCFCTTYDVKTGEGDISVMVKEKYHGFTHISIYLKPYWYSDGFEGKAVIRFQDLSNIPDL